MMLLFNSYLICNKCTVSMCRLSGERSEELIIILKNKTGVTQTFNLIISHEELAVAPLELTEINTFEYNQVTL